MSDISKIEKLYSRFAVDFLGEIKSDEFYAYFDNMLRSGTANIALSEESTCAGWRQLSRQSFLLTILFVIRTDILRI